MATKDGFYGSDDTSNTFQGNGAKWFTLVDKKLGDIDLYEELLDDDKRAGTIFSNTGKLEFNPNWFDADNKHKEFLNNNITKLKSLANETVTNGFIKDNPGASPESARNQANKLTKGNKALTATEQEEGSKPTNGMGPEFKSQPSPGTKEGGFGVHVFPTSLRTNEGGQDFLKIDMMKFLASQRRGEKGASALGIADRQTDRKSIGSVILPIPGGIRDSQQVSWNQDTVTPWELAKANVALDIIDNESPIANAERTVNAALGDKGTASAAAKLIAGMASGSQNFLTRTTGAVMNPNMELLFNGPGMRSFAFAFTLAPRSQNEAMTIIKIIRFFKQGMAPIRSKSRLFLKSPHTFRLAYKRNGHMDDGIGVKNHPYLNQFKECAMDAFSVDYTPNGQYSTYEDGVMTAYNITLNFREMNPIYNDDYGDVPSQGLPAEIGF